VNSSTFAGLAFADAERDRFAALVRTLDEPDTLKPDY
jgi:hypothetical protein